MSRTARFLLLLLQVAFPIFLGVLLATCGNSRSTNETVLVVSGDTEGWITPCGCTVNQSGGMPRRASYINALRAKGTDVLYADAGGAAMGTSDYQKLRFEAILQGELQLAITAHNIGGSEAALGATYLRDLQTRMKMPLVSANLRDAKGQAVAPAYLTVKAGDRSIAIIGVLSKSFAAPDMKIEEPAPAIRAAMETARTNGGFDTLVILAYLPEEELTALAQSLPEADAIIGGPTGQSISPRPVGPVMLAAATRKGKFLVEMDLPRKPAAGSSSNGTWNGRIIELAATYPDDPTQVQNVANYLAALKTADFESTKTGMAPNLVTTADFKIAGSASCTQCHAEDNAVWLKMKHSHAWESLAAKHYEVDPSCQKCHTTGYGLPGGFFRASLAPQNVGVGCENCHGPSSAHVANTAIKTPWRATDQCIRCHDAENSPTFTYDEYWPRIKHGEIKTTKTRGT